MHTDAEKKACELQLGGAVRPTNEKEADRWVYIPLPSCVEVVTIS